MSLDHDDAIYNRQDPAQIWFRSTAVLQPGGYQYTVPGRYHELGIIIRPSHAVAVDSAPTTFSGRHKLQTGSAVYSLPQRRVLTTSASAWRNGGVV